MATRTLTVVFTDLANYTASVGRSDRQELRNLIAAHEKMVAPHCANNGSLPILYLLGNNLCNI